MSDGGCSGTCAWRASPRSSCLSPAGTGGCGQRGSQQGSAEGQQQTLRHLDSEGTRDRFPREAWAEQETDGSQNSLSLEVVSGPIQTHDQIFFPRFQLKAARGSDQEVSGLISSGLGILG